MQINGVGNETGHNHNMHQVKEPANRQNISKKSGTTMNSAGENATRGNVGQHAQQAGGFSLSFWWKKLLAGGQKLFVSIWGEAPSTKNKEAEDDVEAPINTMGAEAAAASGLRQQDLHNNPYFSAIEDTGKEKQTIWEKIRVRFRELTGHLTGRFSNRDSFQTGQQRSKEDLRKRSTYKQDDLEIDCILTDDSYLMDSYDSKGGYSKLSPKK